MHAHARMRVCMCVCGSQSDMLVFCVICYVCINWNVLLHPSWQAKPASWGVLRLFWIMCIWIMCVHNNTYMILHSRMCIHDSALMCVYKGIPCAYIYIYIYYVCVHHSG